jgi:hypothetical protein
MKQRLVVIGNGMAGMRTVGITGVRVKLNFCSLAIKVGQPVARLPPHKSRRAELPHRAFQRCSLRTWHINT